MEPSISCEMILGGMSTVAGWVCKPGNIVIAGCNRLQEVAYAVTANVCDGIEMGHIETG